MTTVEYHGYKLEEENGKVEFFIKRCDFFGVRWIFTDITLVPKDIRETLQSRLPEAQRRGTISWDEVQVKKCNLFSDTSKSPQILKGVVQAYFHITELEKLTVEVLNHSNICFSSHLRSQDYMNDSVQENIEELIVDIIEDKEGLAYDVVYTIIFDYTLVDSYEEYAEGGEWNTTENIAEKFFGAYNPEDGNCIMSEFTKEVSNERVEK